MGQRETVLGTGEAVVIKTEPVQAPSGSAKALETYRQFIRQNWPLIKNIQSGTFADGVDFLLDATPDVCELLRALRKGKIPEDVLIGEAIKVVQNSNAPIPPDLADDLARCLVDHLREVGQTMPRPKKKSL